jgi:hypothetical protein
LLNASVCCLSRGLNEIPYSPDKRKELQLLKIFILLLLAPTSRHEFKKSPEILDEVVGYFDAAGEKYDVPSSLLAYWAWKESRFKHNIVAWDRPSIGYAQAHGLAQKWCEGEGYKIQQREGGAMCIGYLFRRGLDECGNMLGAAVWYASGSCEASKEVRKIMSDRLRDWSRRKITAENKYIEQITNDEKLDKIYDNECSEVDY